VRSYGEDPVELALPHEAGASEAGDNGSGLPVGLLIGAGAIVVIGAGALVASRRSRAA
jgi:hypothetical protein